MHPKMTDESQQPLVEKDDPCCTLPKREKYSCEGMFCCYLPVVVMQPASFWCNKAAKIEAPYVKIKSELVGDSHGSGWTREKSIENMPSDLQRKATAYKAAGCATGTVLFVPAVAAWGVGCAVDILDTVRKAGESCCPYICEESPPSHSMR